MLRRFEKDRITSEMLNESQPGRIITVIDKGSSYIRNE